MSTFTLDALRELLRHMEWADATIWRATLAHPAAVADSRLRDLLLHLHGVQRAFLTMWTSQPLVFAKREDLPDIAAVHSWSQPYYGELSSFIATIDEASLSRTIVDWRAVASAFDMP